MVLWREIVRFLSQWVSPDAAVLDVACDRGDGIRHISQREVASRPARRLGVSARSEVSASSRPTASSWPTPVPTNHFDLVFMSNYLEHLHPSTDAVVEQALASRGRILQSGRPAARPPAQHPARRRRLYWDYVDHKVHGAHGCARGGGGDRGPRCRADNSKVPSLYDQEPDAAAPGAGSYVPAVSLCLAVPGKADAPRGTAARALMSGTAARFMAGVAASVVAIALLFATVEMLPARSAASRASMSHGSSSRWLFSQFSSRCEQSGGRSWLGAAAGNVVQARRLAGPLAVGYLANAVFPARLGEVARIVLVARRELLPAGMVAASVVVERAAATSTRITTVPVVARLDAGDVQAIRGLRNDLGSRRAQRHEGRHRRPRRRPYVLISMARRVRRAARRRPDGRPRAWRR